ncbi:ribonuclease H-like domain-containing protein [Tanacetum coccineum]
MIGDPSRSVSTKKQLQTDAMWCFFDAFVTLVEPKKFKQAMTEPSWIDAMQEEIHEFKRLSFRNFVVSDKVLLINLNGFITGQAMEFAGFALRNFDLEDMEFESTNSGTTAMILVLKLVTAKEKTNKKNDVKARSLLLMALPKEHQLTFTTKKTQKTLLKQQYENFRASSAESLDSIFNRLQKIVSRLVILGVVIAQEDLNPKFLSCLPPEWNTHVVVWMNKPEYKTMNIHDLYNNFKIVEQRVKKSVGASNGAQNLAFMTAPSTSSTNEINTNPNGSNLLQQDLEQIHEDDLEVIDLNWQLYLLSMRAKRYYQRIGKKILINANDIVGFDKSKVECFNCHKMRHFARECRVPRNKEVQFRNQDNTRKQGNNEDTSSKAMLAIDGVGFDWSDMTEE